MQVYNIPYGVALIYTSLTGLHFYIDEQYAYRPDRIIERISGPSVIREMGSNELSKVSPITLSPGTLYTVASTKFDSLFRKSL